MEKYLLDSKIFVMTSITESFGIVLIEAMSYKIPCIAFDTADGARNLLNNKNGILVSNRSKETMIKDLIALLKDDKKLAKIANAGYITASRMTDHNMAIDYLQKLENI